MENENEVILIKKIKEFIFKKDFIFIRNGIIYFEIKQILELKNILKKNLKSKNESKEEKLNRREKTDFIFIKMIKDFVIKNSQEPNPITIVNLRDVTITLFHKHNHFIIKLIQESNNWDYVLPKKVYIVNAPFCFKQIWDIVGKFFSKELKLLLEVKDKESSKEVLKLITI
jgi:hypothetical protein